MKKGEIGLTEVMHTMNGNNKPDRTKPLLLLLGVLHYCRCRYRTNQQTQTTQVISI